MDLKTLRQKTPDALKKDLVDAHAHLKELSFKRSANQLTDVREIREVKKTVARINTLLSQPHV